jgi:hypothetical protein
MNSKSRITFVRVIRIRNWSENVVKGRNPLMKRDETWRLLPPLERVSSSQNTRSCIEVVDCAIYPRMDKLLIRADFDGKGRNKNTAEFIVFYSKIPWYPKLLFQRNNALASFRVQMVLVTQPRPSQVMIKHNFLLWGILIFEIKPSASGLCWDTKNHLGCRENYIKTLG